MEWDGDRSRECITVEFRVDRWKEERRRWFRTLMDVLYKKFDILFVPVPKSHHLEEEIGGTLLSFVLLVIPAEGALTRNSGSRSRLTNINRGRDGGTTSVSDRDKALPRIHSWAFI